MMQLERQNEISNYLKKNRKATTNELSELLNVSATTIRTDLNRMEKENLLIKTHGGAVYRDPSSEATELTARPYHFHDRESENIVEKEVIASRAVQYIKDNMCIILDASSTAYTLARKLGTQNKLTVITNGIYTALELKDNPNITVILVGGIVTQQSASIEGLLGHDLLHQIHADIAFVSARGFSIEEGMTDFSIYEAELKKEFINRSAKCIALVDHTKFDSTSISSFASPDDLNLIITDCGIDQTILDLYTSTGVPVEVAGLADGDN